VLTQRETPIGQVTDESLTWRRRFETKLTVCFSRDQNFGSLRFVEIVYEHPDIICAIQEPIFLLWWRRTPTINQAVRAFEHLQKASTSFPGGVVFVVVSGEEVGQPDRATADFFARNTRAIEKHILAHSFILEGQGLKGAAVRTAVRAMNTMSRVIFPWTISSSVDEGAMFLAKKTGFVTEQEARDLIAEIAKIRAAHPLGK